MTRRTALQWVGILAGYIHGRPVNAQNVRQMPPGYPPAPPAIVLTLDQVDVIVIQYRGQQIAVHPAEIMQALSGRG